MKCAWVEEHCDSFPIVDMCRTLQFPKSSFYAWRQREPGPRAQRTASIHDSVRYVFEQSDGIYGSQKIAIELEKDERLETACRNTVATVMRELGLKSKVMKKFNPQTTVSDPTKQPAANILNQEFVATAPNQKWVTDITYIWAGNAWVYLAVVVDLFSRKVVGWSISDSLATPLICEALKNAIELRRPNTEELLIHSDRGCQYTSDAYQQILRSLKITCSMSRTGCCYDNAVAERFFWSLKHEWTNHKSYDNLAEVRRSVFKYIETFYNTVRIHQTLGYLSPDEFESHLAL